MKKTDFMIPNCSLLGTDGDIHNLTELQGDNGTIVMFLSATCPFVLALENRIISLANIYSTKGISFIAICSNNNEDIAKGNSYQDICKHYREKNYSFTYLYDENQLAMKLFDATHTPDFFFFNRKGYLVYNGRFDDCWNDASRVKQQYLKNAIDDLLNGKDIENSYVPSFGCAIIKTKDGPCIDDATNLILSKYIKLFNDGNDNLLVNCLYGNAIELDEDLKIFLKEFKKENNLFAVSKKLNLPSNASEILKQLFDLKILVIPDDDEKSELRNRIEKRRGRVRSGSLVSILRINMSTDCNLRCKYCYMEKASVHREKDKHASTMSLNIALDAVKAFISNAVSNGRRRVSIRYIGGEPLLNIEVLKRTMLEAEQLCKENGIYITHLICTNGLLIDQDFVDFLKTFLDAQVLISLDGVKEVNDKVRVDLANKGTYDRVIETIKLLVKNGISFGVPAVVNSFGLKHIDEFMKKLKELGVKRIGINPPYKFEENDDEFSTIESLADGYFKAWKKAKEMGFQVSGKAFLPEWHAMHGHIANCEGMGRSIVVDPDGHISLCDKICDKLGTIYNLEQVFQTDIYENFAMRVKGNIKGCEDCEINYLCNGGCLAEARNSYNCDSLSGKHCEFIKCMAKRIFKDFN